MDNPYFSIIIPCYNVCNYISQCLDSLKSQEFTNWEAIVINDGSTDNTASIIQKYANNDKRIIFIDKPNEGVSKARNTGLKIAAGCWVGFIDADDWFVDEALKKLYSISISAKSEIIGFNHFFNLNDKEWRQVNLSPTYIERSGEDRMKFVLDSLFPYYDKYKNNITVGSIRTVWDKIFKRSFLISNNIIFREDVKVVEDSMFCFDAFFKAKAIQYHNEFLIHYRLIDSSVTRNFYPDIDDINYKILDVWKDIISTLILWNEDFENCYIGVACECFYRSLRCNILHRSNYSSIKDKLFMIKKLVNNHRYDKIFCKSKYQFLPVGKRVLANFVHSKQYFLIYAYCSITIKLSNIKSLRKIA